MPLDMKTTMILIDNSEDVKHGSICTGCNFSLKDIFKHYSPLIIKRKKGFAIQQISKSIT